MSSSDGGDSEDEEEVKPKKAKGVKGKPKEEQADEKQGPIRHAGNWGFSCFGCGEKHRWGDCELTSPATKKVCVKCGEKGHQGKMCRVSRVARKEFEEKYGSPLQWLRKKLEVVDESGSSSDENSDDESESGDDWIKPDKKAGKGRTPVRSRKEDKKEEKKSSSRAKEEKGKKAKDDKKGSKGKSGGRTKSKGSSSKKKRDDSSSSESESSSEEEEQRNKKKSKKEKEKEVEAGKNSQEKLLRLQWEARNEMKASGPGTPQGSQGYSPYTAQPPSPYHPTLPPYHPTVGGGSGQQWSQGQWYGPSQAGPQGSSGQGEADWAGWGSGHGGWA